MQYNRIQYNAMHKFVKVLDKYASEAETSVSGKADEWKK